MTYVQCDSKGIDLAGVRCGQPLGALGQVARPRRRGPRVPRHLWGCPLHVLLDVLPGQHELEPVALVGDAAEDELELFGGQASLWHPALGAHATAGVDAEVDELRGPVVAPRAQRISCAQNTGAAFEREQGTIDCSGTYAFAFTRSFLTSQGVAPGMSIYGQFWSRDPGYSPPNNCGLTDAVSFVVLP